MPVKRPPVMVLCAGLKSNGSTWVYNAVIQLMKAANAAKPRRHRPKVMAFYADKMESVPAEAARAGEIIIKTHIPAPGILLLSQMVRAKVIITVREPRDAIASLLQRFGHAFDVALREVSAGAKCLVELADGGPCMLLRYEDRFVDRVQTLAEIAKFLGMKVPPATLARIHASLTPDKVSRRIETLHRKGVFGKRPTSNSFDALTHWHPGHIGDGRIGKYATVLSAQQQRAVTRQTASYRRLFGYSAANPHRGKQSFKGK